MMYMVLIVAEEEKFMKNKKCRFFLFVSFLLFTLSVVAAISSMIVSYYKVKTGFPGDDTRLTDEVVAIAFVCTWMIIPCWGLELSFIRSVYKMLKYKPNKLVRICYIISASLTVLSFAFYFAISKIFNFVSADGRDYTGDIFLFTLWPSFILSFALGSIPIRHNRYMVNQNSSDTGTPFD